MQQSHKSVINDGVEGVVTYIKSNGYYEFYKKLVIDGEENTHNFLNRITLAKTVSDKYASLLIANTAFDILFSIVDQRLRSEILGENKSEADRN